MAASFSAASARIAALGTSTGEALGAKQRGSRGAHLVRLLQKCAADAGLRNEKAIDECVGSVIDWSKVGQFQFERDFALYLMGRYPAGDPLEFLNEAPYRPPCEKVADVRGSWKGQSSFSAIPGVRTFLDGMSRLYFDEKVKRERLLTGATIEDGGREPLLITVEDALLFVETGFDTGPDNFVGWLQQVSGADAITLDMVVDHSKDAKKAAEKTPYVPFSERS